MAIPVGTTSRQLEHLARWALVAVMALGMLTWWWPGYRAWGAMSAGLLAVLVLWLLWRTASADRTVPGHPIHAALLVPVLILGWHLARSSTGPDRGDKWALAGALDASMIFHFALLSLGVMLSQALLPKASRHVSVLGACGAAMMLGPAAAMAWGPAAPVRTSLAMLGFAGVAVWLSMLWGAAPPVARPDERPGHSRRRRLRIACGCVAAIAAAALTLIAPLQALLVAGIVSAAVFVAGLVFRRRRVALLLAGGGGAVAVVSVLTLVSWVREALFALALKMGRASWLGEGEQAFRYVSASDSGLVVLSGVVGLAGTLCLLLGLTACITWLLIRARRGSPGDPWRAILWTAAAGSVAGAMLAPGGLFVPAVALGAAFVWGLLPAMLGRPPRARSGLVLLAGMVAVTVVAGLARNPGLPSWGAEAFGATDALLHVTTGLLLGMLMAWLLGSRFVEYGLLGIALAAFAGGVGEALQYLSGLRTAEFGDWLHHMIGSAAAIAPYLLCMGGRWCESAEARPGRGRAYEAYLRP